MAINLLTGPKLDAAKAFCAACDPTALIDMAWETAWHQMKGDPAFDPNSEDDWDLVKWNWPVIKVPYLPTIP